MSDQDLDVELDKIIQTGVQYADTSNNGYYLQQDDLRITRNAIKSLFQTELEKAKHQAFLDGQKFGIETTMKLHNIPKRVITLNKLKETL